MRTILWLMLLCCLDTSSLVGQSYRPPGTRLLALGGLVAAMPAEPWGAWANPASLADLRTWSVSVLAVPQPFELPELRTLAVATTVPLPTGAGSLAVRSFGGSLYRESELSAACGLPVFPRISVGASMHVLDLAVLRYGRAFRWEADVGTLAHPADDLWIGVTARAIMGSAPLAQGVPRPTTISAGLTAEVGQGCLISGEAEVQSGFPLATRLGVEWGPTSGVVLRIGGSDEPRTLSAGCAVGIAGWEFSYAGVSHPLLGWTHAFAVTWGKGGLHEEL